jgi:hypothetical protein
MIFAVAMASLNGWSLVAGGYDGITAISKRKQGDILFFLQ